jgi:hypothetical protein
LDEAETRWAPPDDPVFQLVPPAFLKHVSSAYQTLQQPDVSFETFWDIFLELRDLVEVNAMPNQVSTEVQDHASFEENEDRTRPIFPNLGQFNIGHSGMSPPKH